MGCNNIGSSYIKGKGVKQDEQKGFNFIHKACEMGEALACENEGIAYYNGYGVRTNESKAKYYFGKACDLGNQSGCEQYKILNK